MTELGGVAHHVAVRVGQQLRDFGRKLLGEVDVDLVVDDFYRGSGGNVMYRVFRQLGDLGLVVSCRVGLLQVWDF